MNNRWTSVTRLLDRVTLERDTRSDATLLAAYVSHGDAEAFARLVRRHGPMVQGVCRRVLGDAHDVEDAFQATFLVLLRKAPSLKWRERLAPWLHGVAHRTALKARARRARSRAMERPTDTMNCEPTTHESPRLDGLDCLDEELLALPERYRQPLVLCELEGLARRDAARVLKLPEGTLSSRLARGRRMLRQRLLRRGVALSASGLLTLLAGEARANVGASLMAATVRVAHAFRAGETAGEAARVLSLAEGVVKSMLLAKLKVISALAALVLILGGSAANSLATAWGRDENAEPAARQATRSAGEPALAKDEQFVISIRIREHSEGSKSRTLAAPRIVARPSQPVYFHVGGELPTALPSGQTKGVASIPHGVRVNLTVSRLDEERVSVACEANCDESEHGDDFDYRIVGTHAKFQKKVRLGHEETIVLRKHANGAPLIWMEVQVDSAPRGAVVNSPSPPVAVPSGVPPLPGLPIAPALPQGFVGKLSLPGRELVPPANQRLLTLRHHSADANGPSMVVLCDDVRLQATRLALSVGDRQFLIVATHEGILVEHSGTKSLCGEVVAAINGSVLSTCKEKLIATRSESSTTPLMDVAWGEARITCSRLAIGSDTSLAATEEGVVLVRGGATIRATRLELDLGDGQVRAEGTGGVQLKERR